MPELLVKLEQQETQDTQAILTIMDHAGMLEQVALLEERDHTETQEEWGTPGMDRREPVAMSVHPGMDIDIMDIHHMAPRE